MIVNYYYATPAAQDIVIYTNIHFKTVKHIKTAHNHF